ncbi:alpha/beta hydrolase family protein [Xanthomonas citri]|uniref:alpha/beta hydrolase family protein n=1 Tax=Xanthomonas citri TaxID=346 RepID=UPI001CBE1255|nr:alpha/beta fold hydrolase [Xanthomonas citri]
MKKIRIPLNATEHVDAAVHGGHESGRPVVILQPATAVPERLYVPFANYLAGRGLTVISYNYRGVGRDAGRQTHRHLRMRDWANDEVNAVIRTAAELYPGSPLMAIGHSFGGHAVGLSEQSRRLTAAVLIASHAGYLGFIKPFTERLKAIFLLHVLGRISNATIGYLPGKKLGLGEDLAGGVVEEWRQWTKLPHYFFDDITLGAREKFSSISCPILCYGFTDDPWATEPAIDELVSHFTSATITPRQISPTDIGSRAIGHLGFFRERHRESLWPGVADWLIEHAQ